MPVAFFRTQIPAKRGKIEMKKYLYPLVSHPPPLILIARVRGLTELSNTQKGRALISIAGEPGGPN